MSESARANLFATDEARRGVILTLVSSVATNYLTLRGLDEQLVIANRTLGTYAESVRLYQLQFKYGQTSQMTVSQAQSQYESAAAQIPQIESQIAQTENALSVLLGKNPGPIPRGKSVYDLALPTVPAGVPSALLERRPDLLQSEQTLIAANAQIGAARALYFPTISLTGAFGGASAQLSNLFSGPARAWNYTGQVVGPIFTFGAVSGQVAEAEAAQRAALYNYRFSIQNAFADVDNALVANAKLQDQLGAQERLVAALKDYARLAKLQYDGGYTSYTTVLQAEQSLFPAELTLASVRASVFASAANTYKAMGGGWVTTADTLTTGGAKPPLDERSRSSRSSDVARPPQLEGGARGRLGYEARGRRPRASRPGSNRVAISAGPSRRGRARDRPGSPRARHSMPGRTRRASSRSQARAAGIPSTRSRSAPWNSQATGST